MIVMFYKKVGGATSRGGSPPLESESRARPVGAPVPRSTKPMLLGNGENGHEKSRGCTLMPSVAKFPERNWCTCSLHVESVDDDNRIQRSAKGTVAEEPAHSEINVACGREELCSGLTLSKVVLGGPVFDSHTDFRMSAALI